MSVPIQNEIGGPVRASRRQRAKCVAKPNLVTPAAEPISEAERPKRGRRASSWPVGPYREAYNKRRSYTTARNESGGYAERAEQLAALAIRNGKKPAPANLEGKLTDGHLKNDAMRIVSKRLLLDLYLAWRGKPFDPSHIPARPSQNTP